MPWNKNNLSEMNNFMAKELSGLQDESGINKNIVCCVASAYCFPASEEIVRHELELSIRRRTCFVYINRKLHENRMHMLAGAPLINVSQSCSGSYANDILDEMCEGCEFYKPGWPKNNPILKSS